MKAKFNTVGVRFANNPRQIYTYRVRKLDKIKLGDELVADTPDGASIVFAVLIDPPPPPGITLKYITRRVAAL